VTQDENDDNEEEKGRELGLEFGETGAGAGEKERERAAVASDCQAQGEKR
jgi:hypothetical protein